MSKRQLFNITYRYAIPAVIVLAFASTQGFRISSQLHSIFAWVICFVIAGNYSFVTTLDQVPTKKISFWKPTALWRRSGGFRGDQFTPFVDRSIMKYYYFFVAIGNPMFGSVFIAWSLPSLGFLPVIFSIIHFILMFIPFVVFYPAFMEALYPIEVGESDYEPNRHIH